MASQFIKGVALVASTALPGVAWAENAIRIGGITSISGGGSGIGAQATAAFRLAVAEINANGGLLGRRVELVEADTQTNPTHGVAELRRLAESAGVVAIVGPGTSQEVIPTVALSTEFGLMQVTTAASTALTPAVGPLHFSTSPIGLHQVIPSVEYGLAHLGVSKFAIISDNGGMSKAAVADLIAWMAEKGITPVEVQEFAFKSEDITPQLFSMRNAGADAVVVINSLPDDSMRLLQNMEDIGWAVPVLTNLTTSSNAGAIATALGVDAVRNVWGTAFIGVTWCPGDAPGTSPFAQFAAHASAEIPGIERLGGPASVAQYYLGPMIVAAAIKGSGSTDGRAMVDWLLAQDRIDTVLGPLSASKDSHFLPGLSAMTVIREPWMMREDGTVQRAICD